MFTNVSRIASVVGMMKIWMPSYLGMILALSSLASASAQGTNAGTSNDGAASPNQSAEAGDRLSGNADVAPISVEGGKAIVDVTINERGPFPMIFDTGSPSVVTRGTAAALGLTITGGKMGRGSAETDLPVGMTRLETLRLGNAELSNEPFFVVRLPALLTDRGSRRPIAGIIGYDLLAKFVVRLDYEGSTLTLTPAGEFRYRGSGVRVSLLNVDMGPTVNASADGIRGKFVLDTGSTGSLALHRRLVERYGFEARHPHGFRVKSIGADGLFDTIVTRIDRFDIAGAQIKRPAAEFPAAGKAGLPWKDVDGSVGYEILRQFVITFDHSRRELWFERSSAFGERTAVGRAGFQAVKGDAAGFRVFNVIPNTPAEAAGMKIGDVIVEVDGEPSKSINQTEFGALMRRPDGTQMHLTIVRNDIVHPVVLTLKELLP